MLEYYIAQFWEIATIEFLLIFAGVYYLILWIVLFFWVGRDIQRRTGNIFYIFICQLFQILPPPFGLLIYIIIRPWKNNYKQFLEEVDENIESLKEYVEVKNTAIVDMHEDTPLTCHNCEKEIEKDFIICPHCLTNLRHPCRKCKREIRSSWEVCPYCATRQKEVFKLGKGK
ncbi:zinc ribbon domain-containing protein [Candidatus Gracilibacteria bacterium]|nr:zinc ribbon domain-containing protein [Candidatus Gracilibacteria bacterium]